MNVHYGDVLIKYGSILDAESDEIPYIASGKESKKQCYLSDGDVIIADTAEDETVGKCTEIINIQDAKIEAGLHTIPCHPRTAYAPMFLGYYMNSPHYHKQLIPLMQGVKVLSVSKSNIGNTLISAPVSYLEQEKIVELLHLLDYRMLKQQEVIDSLKKYKRGLLCTYFMTDEWNTHSQWKRCKLGVCCSKIGSGKTPRGGSSVYVDHGIMFLRSQNVLWGTLDINDVSYIDEETNSTMLSSEVRFGDVLLNITGASIGRSCIYHLTDRANVNQHVCILRLSHEGRERLHPEFLLQQILSDRIQQQVMDCQNGGSREGLNFQQIADFDIVLPDIEEQRKICEMLNTFDCKVIGEETVLNALFNLRASLMQQLFI